ncbi:MAG: FkbM family methyltransferase [Xanthobacteraceae bacterium]|nr:FkbM family methyltransferase [Xanthobacteraceae bacterium]
MGKLAQALLDFAGRRLGINIARDRRIGPLFEKVHLRRFLRHFNIDCVFDVGANGGQYAEMLRRSVGYQGLIISFEPVPEVFAELEKKTRRDSNWIVEQVALDDRSGETMINVMREGQFSSLLEPKHDEVQLFKSANVVTGRQKIRTERLSAVYNKYADQFRFSRPFLKLDTQGNDLKIAKEARGILHHFVGIQSELSIKRIYDGAPTFAEAICFYQECGFELSAFVPNNEGFFPRLIETDCIMVRTNLLEG